MSYKPYNTLKASGLEVKFQNGAGSPLPKGTPVRKNSLGSIAFIDVSVEAEVLGLVGVTNAVIADTAIGSVITAGRIENVTITATFGDPVYIAKDGSLTNLKPEIGVGGFLAGDFVVRIATVSRNETNPLQKDLVLEIMLVGQLG